MPRNRQSVAEFINTHLKTKGYLPMLHTVEHELGIDSSSCRKEANEAREKGKLRLERNLPLDPEGLTLDEIALLTYAQWHQSTRKNRPNASNMYGEFTKGGKQPPIGRVLKSLRRKLGNDEFHRWFIARGG